MGNNTTGVSPLFVSGHRNRYLFFKEKGSMKSLVNAIVRISTAVPEEIQAAQSRFLSMVVCDKTGNMPEFKIERALVVPNLTKGLTATLTSHLELVENGQTDN